jgi:hypothetical protein
MFYLARVLLAAHLDRLMKAKKQPFIGKRLSGRTQRSQVHFLPADAHTTHNRYNIRPYSEKVAAFNSQYRPLTANRTLTA